MNNHAGYNIFLVPNYFTLSCTASSQYVSYTWCTELSLSVWYLNTSLNVIFWLLAAKISICDSSITPCTTVFVDVNISHVIHWSRGFIFYMKIHSLHLTSGFHTAEIETNILLKFQPQLHTLSVSILNIVMWINVCIYSFCTPLFAALKTILWKESTSIFSHSSFPLRAAGPAAVASDGSG